MSPIPAGDRQHKEQGPGHDDKHESKSDKLRLCQMVTHLVQPFSQNISHISTFPLFPAASDPDVTVITLKVQRSGAELRENGVTK